MAVQTALLQISSGEPLRTALLFFSNPLTDVNSDRILRCKVTCGGGVENSKLICTTSLRNLLRLNSIIMSIPITVNRRQNFNGSPIKSDLIYMMGDVMWMWKK